MVCVCALFSRCTDIFKVYVLIDWMLGYFLPMASVFVHYWGGVMIWGFWCFFGACTIATRFSVCLLFLGRSYLGVGCFVLRFVLFFRVLSFRFSNGWTGMVFLVCVLSGSVISTW